MIEIEKYIKLNKIKEKFAKIDANRRALRINIFMRLGCNRRQFLSVDGIGSLTRPNIHFTPKKEMKISYNFNGRILVLLDSTTISEIVAKLKVIRKEVFKVKFKTFTEEIDYFSDFSAPVRSVLDIIDYLETVIAKLEKIVKYRTYPTTKELMELGVKNARVYYSIFSNMSETPHLKIGEHIFRTGIPWEEREKLQEEMTKLRKEAMKEDKEKTN